MTSEIQRLFEALPPEGSIDELGLVIDRIRDVYDLEHVVYHAVSLGSALTRKSQERAAGALQNGAGLWLREPEALVTFTYPQSWGERYLEQQYRRIDPVVESAMVSFLPFDWKSLAWNTKKRRQLLGEAISSGLGNQGYTVPIRGPDGQFALFTVNKSCSDSEWERFLNTYKTDFMVIAHFYHQRVLEIERIFGNITIPSLSEREKDALTYIASGRGRAEVAYDLKISENTLRVYLDSARHKLGALNLPHAIALAVQRGIVTI